MHRWEFPRTSYLYSSGKYGGFICNYWVPVVFRSNRSFDLETRDDFDDFDDIDDLDEHDDLDDHDDFNAFDDFEGSNDIGTKIF